MSLLKSALRYKKANIIQKGLLGAGLGTATGAMGDNPSQDIISGLGVGAMGGMALGAPASMNPQAPVKANTPKKPMRLPRIR
jgi:hypothetical protein